jgi:hypothetical protein
MDEPHWASPARPSALLWLVHSRVREACHRAGHGPDPWGGFDTLTCSGKTLAVAIDGFLRFQAKERLQRAKIVPVLHRR